MELDLPSLLAHHSCTNLVLRAAALTDAGDAQGLSEQFTPDAVLVRPNAQPLEGRSAILAAYAQRPSTRITRHLVTNTRVELQGPAAARARSYVLLWTGEQADAEGPAGRPAQARQVVGEFDDLLTRSPEGHWLIQRREARFVLYRES